MLFNSLHFLAFFPVVTGLFFLLRPQWRWLLLLVSSYYFYMAWKPEYAILIFASTVVDYLVSRKMATLSDKKKRKPWLWISLAANLGMLITFKYFNWFIDNTNAVIGLFGGDFQIGALDVLLPVGISFYTFQTLSYTLDVYHGRLKPEPNFGKFALYVSFFPQLVAGPIERATTFLPQIQNLNYKFDGDRIVAGIRLMIWGLFKKVVIADRLALYVNEVYGHEETYSGLQALLATIFFAFQIYCDFSGYSDIAIGAARVLGINLMTNFRFPYFSANIREFWSRWHISLSTWFRDYVYIPLGGNRVTASRMYFNTAVVFLVSGIWHGANWTFLIWGALHTLYFFGYSALGEKFNRKNSKSGFLAPRRLAAMLVTFGLVCFAWIFFRAENLDHAMVIIQRIALHPFDGGMSLAVKEFGNFSILLGGVMVAFMLIVEVLKFTGKAPAKPSIRTDIIFATCCLAFIMLFGVFGEQSFIYFQF